MAKFYPTLTPHLQTFIAEQHLFFVATAPHQGRVNLSPKGADTFRCLGDCAFAYLDLTGSGNETAAHVNENGRLTVMFCSFGPEPTILRLYGRARVVRPQDPDWPALVALFPPLPGTRQIFRADLLEAQTSCGYGVPHYEWVGPRSRLQEWAERKGEAGLVAYRQQKNQRSIDGLPAYPHDL